MFIPSRRLLFCLAVSGWFGTAASAQELQFISEPSPAPAAEFNTPYRVVADPLVPSTTSIEPIPDTDTGIVHISDCPPGGRTNGVAERKRHEPPTTGWVPPGRYIMHRHWVPYYKFFPNSWTGTPTPAPQLRLPTVYMPTDTTQLGYYYQHVPHWHAYSGMTPPVPRPMDWHAKYQAYPVASPTYRVVPKEDLGEPGDVPMPSDQQPAPPPPVQDLNKSAASPGLLPLPQ